MSNYPLCRADHIGSHLRPKRLRDAHKALEQERWTTTASPPRSMAPSPPRFE